MSSMKIFFVALMIFAASCGAPTPYDDDFLQKFLEMYPDGIIPETIASICITLNISGSTAYAMTTITDELRRKLKEYAKQVESRSVQRQK